jgi:undecaprenyl-diphosphatase
MGAWDLALFRWINGHAGGWPLLDRLAVSIVNDYLVPLVLALALFVAWFLPQNASYREEVQRKVLATVGGLALANLIVEVLNLLFPRLRPFVEHEVNLLFYPPTDPSFPNNQAAVGFAVAAGLWAIDRRAGAAAYVLAALWALSRVYVGVSYPFDVLAGAVLGVLATVIAARVLRWLEPLPTLFLRWCRRWYLA